MPDSRPDPTAPTLLDERRRRPSRSERAARRSDRRGIDELSRALAYNEVDVEDLDIEVFGDKDYPGLRSVVKSLTDLMDSLQRRSSLMVGCLIVIMFTLLYMAWLMGAPR